MTGEVAIVASPGGHVDEAFEIAARFAPRSGRFWITARTPQTEALLAGERVDWVPEVRSREGLRATLSLGRAFRILRDRRPQHLVSTGAALSVPYMVVARALRVPVTYVESATRLSAPSQTGRIMERIPGTRLYHQGSGWNRRSWTEFGSVFDGYSAVPVQPRQARRALVTVGSERFPFARALEVVRDALPGVRISWQTGNTPADAARLRGDVRSWWPGDELAAAAQEADVVVTHAGVGSMLMVLRAGSSPVVIPRMKCLGEHVDDHQIELASLLESRGLVSVVRPGDDIAAHVQAAMARRILHR